MKEDSTEILLRSGCCQVLKIWNRHREVHCGVQDLRLCQWPTIVRKGGYSPRATQLQSNPRGRVGKVLVHLLPGPLGARVHPKPHSGIQKPPGERHWHRGPHLPQGLFLKVPGRPPPEGGDDKVHLACVRRMIERTPGCLLPGLISSLQTEGSAQF